VTDITAPPIPPERFRAVLGHFCTGITIVTARDSDGPVGMTAQSFAALSLDPPLVLVCPGKASSSWPRIEATGAFCVNVLGEHQEEMCRGFAISGVDKFDGVGYRPSPHTASPLLSDVLAWVDCRLDAVYEGGDHVIAVGRVLDLGVENEGGKPLLFYRGGYGRFEV
jgi:3-hydroxy-9,10-secoandrosta-1,3,5(10)-triene-9,17-dione monooxygenase reductase component